MTKTIMYTYLGTNGTICTPIHLEDTYYIRKMHLRAESGCRLTKDNRNFVKQIIVPEEDADNWYEVNVPEGQN